MQHVASFQQTLSSIKVPCTRTWRLACVRVYVRARMMDAVRPSLFHSVPTCQRLRCSFLLRSFSSPPASFPPPWLADNPAEVFISLSPDYSSRCYVYSDLPQKMVCKHLPGEAPRFEQASRAVQFKREGWIFFILLKTK